MKWAKAIEITKILIDEFNAFLILFSKTKFKVWSFNSDCKIIFELLNHIVINLRDQIKFKNLKLY